MPKENNADQNEKDTEYLDESYDDETKTDQVEEDWLIFHVLIYKKTYLIAVGNNFTSSNNFWRKNICSDCKRMKCQKGCNCDCHWDRDR